MEYITELIYIAIVLLMGTLASVLAYSLKTSDIFILLLVGMIFGRAGTLSFSNNFIVILSTFALIFVAFNGSFDFKLKEIKKYLWESVKFTLIYFLLCLLILTFAMIYLFHMNISLNSILLGMLFSIICYGTDSTVVLSLFKGIKNKYIEIAEIESLINTPPTIIPSLIILSILESSNTQSISLIYPIFSFFQSIFVAIILSLVMGWVVITILKKFYFGDLTHLAVITSAVIVYVGTEYLGGSGVLAASIYGIVFGNSHISHLIEIEKVESVLTNSIKILTFMLLGTIIMIKQEYILKGTILFVLYIFVRFLSAIISFKKEKIKFKESLFLALTVPKGVDVALILILTISVHGTIENMAIVANLAMIVVLYSIALSSVVSQFSHHLIVGTDTKNVKKV